MRLNALYVAPAIHQVVVHPKYLAVDLDTSLQSLETNEEEILDDDSDADDEENDQGNDGNDICKFSVVHIYMFIVPLPAITQFGHMHSLCPPPPYFCEELICHCLKTAWKQIGWYGQERFSHKEHKLTVQCASPFQILQMNGLVPLSPLV